MNRRTKKYDILERAAALRNVWNTAQALSVLPAEPAWTRVCARGEERQMIRQVALGVYEISLAWSNAYLLKAGEEAALIDTGLWQDRPRLLNALTQVGVRPEQIRAVYLTHGHCDHAGSAGYFSQALGTGRATIIAHQAEAPFLTTPRRTYAPRGWKRLTRPLTALAFAAGEWRYPVLRCGVDAPIADGDILDAPGGSLRVVACPGHTPGHIAYYREADGLLFSGDAIMNIIPVKRVEGLSLPMPLFTEDWTQAKRSARRLAELRPELLLAGHGWPLYKDTACRLEAWAESL